MTNEDYLKLWEDSAPTPVAGTLTPEEIQKLQGTRLSKEAPWKTYDKEMDGGSVETNLPVRHYDDTSNQNKEEVARQQELSAEVAKQYQWLTPDEYADAGARIGRIIHSSEFIKLLRKAGVKCWYSEHPQKDKVTLLVKKDNQEPEVGCWVQLGFAPELSIMNFDEHGIPLAEKYRGWRTCLLQLIIKGCITEEVANQYFGRPKQTEAFDRYNMTLRSVRNSLVQ